MLGLDLADMKCSSTCLQQIVFLILKALRLVRLTFSRSLRMAFDKKCSFLKALAHSLLISKVRYLMECWYSARLPPCDWNRA